MLCLDLLIFGSNISWYLLQLLFLILLIQMILVTSLNELIGKNTLGAVSEYMKRNTNFLAFWSIMKIVQMMLTGILTGFPKCLSMALLDS